MSRIRAGSTALVGLTSDPQPGGVVFETETTYHTGGRTRVESSSMSAEG